MLWRSVCPSDFNEYFGQIFRIIADNERVILFVDGNLAVRRNQTVDGGLEILRIKKFKRDSFDRQLWLGIGVAVILLGVWLLRLNRCRLLRSLTWRGNRARECCRGSPGFPAGASTLGTLAACASVRAIPTVRTWRRSYAL